MTKTQFENLPTRLGVYTLTRYIGQREAAALYFATQSHVERGVVVEVLRPGADHQEVESFLASARARVAVALPHVTQVFESMVSEEIWYLTQARPEGRNIARVAKEKGCLTPTQICVIVEAAADLYCAAAEKNVAAGPVAQYGVYMSSDDCVSFLSPVQPGEHHADLVPPQQQGLAAVLAPFLPKEGTPGYSRIVTLLDWLTNGYEGEVVDWAALKNTAATVREQLAPLLRKEQISGLNGKTRGAVERQFKRNRRKFIKNLIVAGIGVFVALLAGIAGGIFAPAVGEQLPANDGSTITCMHGNSVVNVAVRPVSIREYEAFLIDFEEKFNRDERKRYLTDVPAYITSPRPLDWEAQLLAANQGAAYNGRTLSPDSPVTGVCYWDALVYARYKNATLPSAAMLQAARVSGNAEVSVCEWTTDVSPAAGIYAAGAVLLPADKNAAPLVEPDRATRKPEYGFRIVYP